MKTQETKTVTAFSLTSEEAFSARILKGESPLESLERKAKRLYGKKTEIFPSHEVRGRFQLVTPCRMGGWSIDEIFYTEPENLRCSF